MQSTIIAGLVGLVIIGFVVFKLYKRTTHQTAEPLPVTDESVDINSVLDQFEQWNQTIQTKEGALDLLGSLDEFCINVFGNHVKFNISKDEFYRLSIDQVKLFISQLIKQIRIDSQSDREIRLQ